MPNLYFTSKTCPCVATGYLLLNDCTIFLKLKYETLNQMNINPYKIFYFLFVIFYLIRISIPIQFRITILAIQVISKNNVQVMYRYIIYSGSDSFFAFNHIQFQTMSSTCLKEKLMPFLLHDFKRDDV